MFAARRAHETAERATRTAATRPPSQFYLDGVAALPRVMSRGTAVRAYVPERDMFLGRVLYVGVATPHTYPFYRNGTVDFVDSYKIYVEEPLSTCTPEQMLTPMEFVYDSRHARLFPPFNPLYDPETTPADRLDHFLDALRFIVVSETHPCDNESGIPSLEDGFVTLSHLLRLTRRVFWGGHPALSPREELSERALLCRLPACSLRLEFPGVVTDVLRGTLANGQITCREERHPYCRGNVTSMEFLECFMSTMAQRGLPKILTDYEILLKGPLEIFRYIFVETSRLSYTGSGEIVYESGTCLYDRLMVELAAARRERAATGAVPVAPRIACCGCHDRCCVASTRRTAAADLASLAADSAALADRLAAAIGSEEAVAAAAEAERAAADTYAAAAARAAAADAAADAADAAAADAATVLHRSVFAHAAAVGRSPPDRSSFEDIVRAAAAAATDAAARAGKDAREASWDHLNTMARLAHAEHTAAPCVVADMRRRAAEAATASTADAATAAAAAAAAAVPCCAWAHAPVAAAAAAAAADAFDWLAVYD